MYDTFIQFTTSDLALLLRELNREQEEKEALEEEEGLAAVQAGGVASGKMTDAMLIADQAARTGKQQAENLEATALADPMPSRLAVRRLTNGI